MRKINPVIIIQFYIGFRELELSKLPLYTFHYDYFLKKYPSGKMLFSDTDSLID